MYERPASMQYCKSMWQRQGVTFKDVPRHRTDVRDSGADRASHGEQKPTGGLQQAKCPDSKHSILSFVRLMVRDVGSDKQRLVAVARNVGMRNSFGEE
ncbi:hypothetical protein J1614_007445 [Plenodomus biglobosus]|nr:hypothetical protein J1614_007445 [Plenodomus biglobosus]